MFKKIFVGVLFVTGTMLLYEVLIMIIFHNPEFGIFGSLKLFLYSLFSGEYFSYHGDLWVLLLYVGIPSIAVNLVSIRFSNKLNFILLPLIAAFTVFFIMPEIPLLIMGIRYVNDELAMYLGIHRLAASVFTVLLCLVFAGYRLIRRRKVEETKIL